MSLDWMWEAEPELAELAVAIESGAAPCPVCGSIAEVCAHVLALAKAIATLRALRGASRG